MSSKSAHHAILSETLSDEEFEHKILENGINYLDDRCMSLITFLMYTGKFKYLSYTKIDIIFKHKPRIYAICTDYFTGIEFVEFKMEFNYILYPFESSTIKTLYIFIKILQSLDLKLITGMKIFQSQIVLEDEELSYNNPVMNIYAYSMLHYIEIFYLTHEYCFNYNYFLLRFLIFNEIERKKKLSNIIFKQIISF